MGREEGTAPAEDRHEARSQGLAWHAQRGKGGRQLGPADLGTGLDGLHPEAAACAGTGGDGLPEQYHLGLGPAGRCKKNLTSHLLAPHVAGPHLPSGQPGTAGAASAFVKSRAPLGGVPDPHLHPVSSPVLAQAASPWELMHSSPPPRATARGSRHPDPWKGLGECLCSGGRPEHHSKARPAHVAEAGCRPDGFGQGF